MPLLPARRPRRRKLLFVAFAVVAVVGCVDVTRPRELTRGSTDDASGMAADSPSPPGLARDASPNARDAGPATTEPERPAAMDAGVDRDVGAAAPDAPSPIPDAQRGESPVLDAAGAVDQKLRDAAVADRPRDAAEIDLAPGAQPDARPTGCAARGPGVLLCEDFEKGLPPRDSVYGYATSANGSVTSESVVVHGGARAAEFRPGDNAGLSRYAVLYRTFTPPLTEGPLHVRFYVRVPADSTMPPWNVFFELVESDVAPGRIKLVQAPGDSITFEVSPGMQSATSSPNALKRDVWQCVQVIVNLSQTSTGRAEYLVDGETRQIISGVATVPTAGWAKVTVGSVTGPDATGVHLYLDDIVVSTQPVGCD